MHLVLLKFEAKSIGVAIPPTTSLSHVGEGERGHAFTPHQLMSICFKSPTIFLEQAFLVEWTRIDMPKPRKGR